MILSSPLYRPTGSREQAAKSAIRTVLDVFFGGSVEHALATHLDDPKAKVDAAQLKRLKALIDQYESEQDET